MEAFLNLDRIYTYRFRGIDNSARAAVWGQIAPYLHRRLGEPQRVLDAGAGAGHFIASCPAQERWAVDAVDHGLRDLTGVTVRIAPILEADLPTGYFDAVFASNLLEHFANHGDIATFLERMHSLLRPGGVIAIMGPNFRYCSAQYFDCADHVVALTHVTVAEHLYGAGFEVTTISPRFLPYSFRSGLRASAALTMLYLRVPLLWRVFGKQFLVFGRRAAD